MSFSVVDKAFDTKLGSHTAKLVLVSLAEHSNEKGFCFPSVEYISERTELSVRQVLRVIQVFRQVNLITKHKVKDDDKNYKYYFNVNVELLGTDLSKQVSEWMAIAQNPKMSNRQLPKMSNRQQKMSVRRKKLSNRQIPHTPYKEEPSVEPSVEPCDTASPVTAEESKLFNLSPSQPKEPSLHSRITNLMLTLYERVNKQKAPWGKPEGRLLKLMLEGNPSITPEIWERCIRNLYASDVRFTSRIPRTYLTGLLLEFQHGSKDKFGSFQEQAEAPQSRKQELSRSVVDALEYNQAEQLRKMGYTAAIFEQKGYDVAALRKIGSSDDTLLKLGFSL